MTRLRLIALLTAVSTNATSYALADIWISKSGDSSVGGTYTEPDESDSSGALKPSSLDPEKRRFVYRFDYNPGLVSGQSLVSSVELTHYDGAKAVHLTPSSTTGLGRSEATNLTENNPYTSGYREEAYDAATTPMCDVPAVCTGTTTATSRYPVSPASAVPSPQGGTVTTASPRDRAEGKAVGSDPVDPFRGELVVRETDLAFPGFGVPYAHGRIYRSRIDYSGPLANGWDHSLNQRLVPSGSDACVGEFLYLTGQGYTQRFKPAASASSATTLWEDLYEAPAGAHVKLRARYDVVRIRRGSVFTRARFLREWKMTTPAGLESTFDAHGLLVRIQDPNGQGLNLSWEPTNDAHGFRLAKVIDSVGRVIYYRYNDLGLLREVSHDASGLKATYSYDASGDLRFATNAVGRIESYTYDTDLEGGSGASKRSNDPWAGLPEPELVRGCELACGVTRPFCGDAPSVCDGVVNSCKATCASCVPSCKGWCKDAGCPSACAAGSGRQEGCVAQCNASCFDPAKLKQTCRDIFYGNTRGWKGPTPDDYCHACSTRVREQCGKFCVTALSCVATTALNASINSDDNDDAKREGAVAADSASQCFDWDDVDDVKFWTTLLWDFWEGLQTLGSLVRDGGECLQAGLEWVFCHEVDLGWFTFTTCEQDSKCEISEETKSRWKAVCNDSCVSCGQLGENCAPGSCNMQVPEGVRPDCYSQCHAAFFGKFDGLPICGVSESDGVPTRHENPSCEEKLGKDCYALCKDDCLDTCVPSCVPGCEKGCESECNLGECSQRCDTDVLADCHEGCVEGCIDTAHKDVGPRYGNLRDLNHNLVSASFLADDGQFVEYLRQDYGQDPSLPSFDTVIHQRNGDYDLDFYYRDLESEARGIVAPPSSGPAAIHAVGRDVFQTVDICRTECTKTIGDRVKPFVGKPIAYVPWQDKLVWFSKRPGAPGDLAPVLRSPRVGAKLSPSVLKLLRSTDGGVEAVLASTWAGNVTEFSLTLAAAKEPVLLRRRSKTEGFQISGQRAALDQLLALSEITALTDSAGTLRVLPGTPGGVLHLASGACDRAFTVVAQVDGQVELSPHGACTNDLVVAPLASAIADTATEDSIAAESTFKATALAPDRLTVRWRRDTQAGSRYAPSVGPEGGAAPKSLGSSARRGMLAAPLFARNPGPAGAPRFAFHVPVDLRPDLASSGLRPPGLMDTPARFDAEKLLMGLCLDEHVLPAHRSGAVGQTDSVGLMHPGFPSSGVQPNLGPVREPPASLAPLSPGPKPSRASVVKDPYGVFWTFYYDKDGQLIREENHGNDGVARVRSFNYDEAFHLVAIERPLGDRTCATYNSDGLITKQVEVAAPGALLTSETMTMEFSGSATFPEIRQTFSYTTFPVRLERVSDPRAPERALLQQKWDKKGNLLGRTDALGNVTRFIPSTLGPPETLIAPDGSETIYEYDRRSGVVESVTVDARGKSPLKTTTRHDLTGRPLEQVTALGEVVTWLWRGPFLDAIQRTGDGTTETTSFAYNADAQLKEVTRGQRVTSVLYDKLGLPRVVAERALDNSTVMTSTCTLYGPGGRVLETVLPEGDRIRYAYDGEGRVTHVERGSLPGSSAGWDDACPAGYQGEYGAEGVVQAGTYDQNGQAVATQDGRGQTTRVAYDGFGRPAIVTDPTGASVRMGYDLLGNILWQSVYSADGAHVPYARPAMGDRGLVAAQELERDLLGRVRKAHLWHLNDVGEPIGEGNVTTTYAYDDRASKVTRTDPSGAMVVHEADGAGRPTKTRYVDSGDFIETAYLDGNRTVQRTWSAPTSDGRLSDTLRLTARGAPAFHQTTEGGSLATLATWHYDALGRLSYTVDAAGLTKTTAYDALDRPRSVATTFSEGSTEVVDLEWDRNGQLRQRTSNAGDGPVATAYAYDALSRLRRIERPEGVTEETEYVGSSALPWHAWDARGARLEYIYTPASQIDSVTVAFRFGSVGENPGSLGDGYKALQRRSFAYDALGRLLRATDTGDQIGDASDDIATSFAWDSLGTKTFEAQADDPAIRHAYAPRVRTLTSNIGDTATSRSYDSMGRLREVWIGQDTQAAAHFDYAGLGGPTTRTLGSGVTTSYAYDALGRLRTQTDTDRLGHSLAAWRWELPLDGVPRVASLRRGDAPEVASVYQLDHGARVVAENHHVEGLDALTLSPLAATTDANDSVSSWAEAGDLWRSYELDGRHNWTLRDAALAELRVAPLRNALDAYTEVDGHPTFYDERGALKAFRDEAYTYNGFGELTGITKGPVSRRFTYDALGRRVRETDEHGEITRYAYDGLSRVLRRLPGQGWELTVDAGLDEHLVRIGASGERVYYHADRQNSVYLLTDSTGAPIEVYDYTAYGEVTVRDPLGAPRPKSTAGNRFGFQGQPFDVEIGLVDMRARLYRPDWGRFITPDPIGLLGGSNLYGFVGGAPLSFWDPLGLSREGGGFFSTLRDAVHVVGRAIHDVLNTGGAIVNGALRAYGDDALMGILGYQPKNTYESIGATFGHAGAAAVGIWEMFTGGTMMAGGGAMVLATPATFGVSAVPGLLTAAGGAALTGHGAGQTKTALSNLFRDNSGPSEAAPPTKGQGVEMPSEAPAARGAPDHHLLTNKNRVSTARGGPWTPRFEDMAHRAGMTLDNAANRVRIPGHRGPHPQAYHEAVFDRLRTATRGLEGDAYSSAFRAELNAIRTEAATAGSALNRLLVP